MTVRSARPRTHGRPLVVRYGPLGDLIVLTAALRALSDCWESPCDVVSSFPKAREVLGELSTVGDVQIAGSRRTPYLLSPDQRQLVSWLRRRQPGPVYVVEERAVDKVLWLLRRGGVRSEHVLGPQECPRGDLEHTVDYLRRLTARPAHSWPPPGSIPDGSAEPELWITAEERIEAQQWVERRGWSGQEIVLFQTLSRRSNRGRWPSERWVEVIGDVVDSRSTVRVVVIGAPTEETEVRRLVGRCDHPRVSAAAADLPLRRLFGLLCIAHSCISLDTGPAQAAAALGCPLVVLMGRADPRRNSPWAPPDRLRLLTGLPTEHWPGTRGEWEASHDVRGISAEAVVEAWRTLPGRAPRP